MRLVQVDSPWRTIKMRLNWLGGVAATQKGASKRDRTDFIMNTKMLAHERKIQTLLDGRDKI